MLNWVSSILENLGMLWQVQIGHTVLVHQGKQDTATTLLFPVVDTSYLTWVWLRQS